MNRMLSSERAFEDFKTPLRKVKYQMLQAKLVAAGASEDKYSILKPSCGVTDRQMTENRKAELVDFYLQVLALDIPLALVPDIMSCDTFAVSEISLEIQ